MTDIINSGWLISCILFILSIRLLSSPQTARLGNLLGMSGMGTAIIISFIALKLPNYPLTSAVIILGAIIGIWSALKVNITSLPQMIAVFNGLGGLAAVFIAISEIISNSPQIFNNILGMIIGGFAFSGSVIAYAKLQNLIPTKAIRFPFQYPINFLLITSIVITSLCFINSPNNTLFFTLVTLVIILGILFVLPIGGADMPVIISILNAYSGWAAVGIGLSLDNIVLIIVGSIVGAGGSILAYIMMKAMNRSILNIITGGHTDSLTPHKTSSDKIPQSGSPLDAAFIMENATKIIIAPGYGMAVAQAQHALKTMAEILHNKYHAVVKFAIHPVAGRMPGHMNVLLAEANVDYTDVYSMDDINTEFASADVAYIIGANDITNPVAKTDPNSPLYGMPILDVAKAKTIFFVKRSLGSGYSGVDNPLFYAPNTIMLYGDAKDITEQIVKALEE